MRDKILIWIKDLRERNIDLLEQDAAAERSGIAAWKEGLVADDEDQEMPEGAWDGEASKPHDAAVQRALVEAQQTILHFLQNRLRDRDEAEEVLQRFSLRALERAAQLRDVRTVRGWLGRILATTIVDHQRDVIRRRQREEELDPETLESHEAEPDAELDAAICNCLYRLLPTLKAEYADIIWRADILGEPRDRLAASLGTSLNNVTVRLHRGRRALRKRLEEMCRTCPIHGFLDCHCEKSEKFRVEHAAVAGRAK